MGTGRGKKSRIWPPLIFGRLKKGNIPNIDSKNYEIKTCP
jgi:hypothetical protein